MTARKLVILVTGGRNYDDLDHMVERLGRYAGRDVTLVHGDCGGADRLAVKAVRRLGCRWLLHPMAADWHKHGRKAGPLRNQRMVEACVRARERGAEVIVEAFPGDRGTADCVRRAFGAALPVRTPTCDAVPL